MISVDFAHFKWAKEYLIDGEATTDRENPK
jgi:hypothetical protein